MDFNLVSGQITRSEIEQASCIFSYSPGGYSICYCIWDYNRCQYSKPGYLLGRSESLIGPIMDQFSEATGIEVEVRYGGTAELAAALLEEAKNYLADIFFAQDPGGLGAVAEAGLLDELPEDILSLVDKRFRSPTGLWVGISGRARVVVYNIDNVNSRDLPEDLSGFTNPPMEGTQWLSRPWLLG
jgi:iron(III) transport system substrate-binding protein